MSSSLHGFSIVKTIAIPELKSIGTLYLHDKTKAQLLSIENDDDNKSFGITFRTPPTNSKGVAHILEHSVLCGSRKYPVKEPFVELVKGSLNTFLNALTYPDKTSYPVASQNLQDFYNLIDVYLDAVFYPKLTKEIFEQEGWHYELKDKNDSLIYKGVVFNEMKGSYSSSDRLLFETIQQSLFPDTTYGHDSGGDPAVIPTLTYEEFKAFHDTYYHPSNAYLFFSGNDPVEKRLQIADSYLGAFEYRKIDSAIPRQSSFSTSKTITRPYPVSKEETSQKKAMVTANWLLPNVPDIKTVLALEILEHILLGSPASPLKRALIESNLGEDTTGLGLETELLQFVFSIGLKGINQKDGEQVVLLVQDTLADLVKKGFDQKDIDAALNTVEFHLREQNTGSFPKGLSLMFSSLSSWLYDKDPFEPLLFEKPLQEIKTALQSDAHYFEKILDQYIVQNTCKTVTYLIPDSTLADTQDKAEKNILSTYKSQLSESEIDEIIVHTEKLQKLQETADSEADLAKLPRLTLQDLDPKIKLFPKTIQEVDGIPLITHDLFTNGIYYIDLGFNAESIPFTLLPYLPLFTSSILELGTKNYSYIQLQQEIHSKTGGIGASLVTTPIYGRNGIKLNLFFRTKCLPTQLKDLVSLLTEVCTQYTFTNKERFKQMVLEEKAGLESSIVDSGHRVVRSRLGSMYSQSDYLGEVFGGVTQLEFVRSLADSFDTQWEKIRKDLHTLASLLFSTTGMMVNVTSEKSTWEYMQTELKPLIQSIQSSPQKKETWPLSLPVRNELLLAPTSVNYVGKGVNLYANGYTYHGSSSVIARYLKTTWLWEQVRVKGGAYGGFTSFDFMTGVFCYLSYRDPRLIETIKTFDESAMYLKNLIVSQDELTKAIIGAISDLDQYMLPDAIGWTSLLQHLSEITDEVRQKRRDEILGTTANDFKKFGKVLEIVNSKGSVSILTNADTATLVKGNLSNPHVVSVL